MKLIGVSIVLALAGAACQPAPVGAQYVEIQPDSAAACSSQCSQIGLELDSVVIMAGHVGCVCSRNDAAPGAGASAGGMATVLIAQQAQRQQQQQSQQQQSQRRHK